jgi:leader peptidase (prepilin peptidase)/N-methyltransferase
MLGVFIVGGLLWGSFLNLVGHRLLSGQSLWGPRSQCPLCRSVIAWYDLVPVFSYIVLGGRCRSCKKPISFLYPFVECFTAIAAAALWFDLYVFGAITPFELLGRGVAYCLLLSGFIVATRTDLEALVVPRVIIWLMAAVGMIASVFGFLPVTVLASGIGAVVGYGSLWLLNYCSRVFTGREGIGEGDMELLAVIGLFWGPVGVWASTLISSCLGILFAFMYLTLTGQGRHTRIPFIPFMAASVIIFLFAQEYIMAFLF